MQLAHRPGDIPGLPAPPLTKRPIAKLSSESVSNVDCHVSRAKAEQEPGEFIARRSGVPRVGGPMSINARHAAFLSTLGIGTISAQSLRCCVKVTFLPPPITGRNTFAV